MKTNKLATLKALVSGDITLDHVIKKVKLILTPDPADKPLVDVAAYQKAHYKAEKSYVAKADKKTIVENKPPEVVIPEPQIWDERTWTPQDEFNFSTSSDKYSDIRRQIGQSITRGLQRQQR